MRIAIEAQRIFRKDKHGMDFVILETLKELQKRKDSNEYYVFVAPGEDRCYFAVFDNDAAYANWSHHFIGAY